MVQSKKGKKKKEEQEDWEYYTNKILKDPMLFQRIVLDGLDEEIVGEDLTRKCIFLCAMGSLVLNSKKTSYNLMVNSESGAGKDHVTDAVLKIIPNHMVHKRTRISPTALTYWHNSKHEPEWTWEGKVLYLEDCANDILNCDVFKVFTSGGSYATIVKDQKAIDIFIQGKPVVIITSASANPENEMIRRFMVVSLNESVEQTKEVMKRWAEKSMKVKKKINFNDYHEALKLLIPRQVEIPWADKLAPKINAEHIHMRTHFSRFLDLIKSSAVLHQFQREINEDEVVIAQQQDYEIAREIIIGTSSNSRMVPLTKNQKEIIDRLKELGMNIIDTELGEREVGWTHSELLGKLPFSKTQLWEELNKLVAFGFISRDNYQFEYHKKKSVVYYYKEATEVYVPTWSEFA